MASMIGTYKNRKIYLNKKLDIKNNTKVKVNVFIDSWIDKYFGVMKNKFKGSSVSFINKLRKSRY